MEEFDYESDSSSEQGDALSVTPSDRLLQDIGLEELRSRDVPFPNNLESVFLATGMQPPQPAITFDCDAIELLAFAGDLRDVLKAGSFTLYGAPKR